MICLEGTGALSHVSLRHHPDVFNEPCIFAAITILGEKPLARVVEGPVPPWKLFGNPGTGNGARGKTYGLPRFRAARFEARFPFGIVTLDDPKVPVKATVTGWSPFIPGDADSSSLPVAALEYSFQNTSETTVEAVYSFNAMNFMAQGPTGARVGSVPGGFALVQDALPDRPHAQGAFAAAVLDSNVSVNCAWFRGGWFDPLSIAWKNIEEGRVISAPPVTEGDPSPGASLFVPFTLRPGEEKTIRLMLSWYVPTSDLRVGDRYSSRCCGDEDLGYYEPWYAGRFASIEEVASYWRGQYDELRRLTELFTRSFYDTSLPPEVIEAVAANLSILKSPTVLRQKDGRLWAWEGCFDDRGCCPGSCTHVWNYAQALPHLFPSLERSLRETEFGEMQSDTGHQAFRVLLPISPPGHDFHAAADGQLGGILKAYRDWRISGDTEWLRRLWPRIKESLVYCIETWDPDHVGALIEPHHNTYDIEFWGPDGMCTSIYLGALRAAVLMGEALGEDVKAFKELAEKAKRYLEEELFDGEYFYQRVTWEGLRAGNPLESSGATLHTSYSPEAVVLLEKEGPKYQYGTGCLSDGVIGAWMAEVCGVGKILDREKVKSHLRSVYRYNFKRDLSEHANPQRPSYAAGDEGGLLLCSWPKGGRPSLPFVYSDEVWTGIEYQVASHMMREGMVEEGLEIVRTCRDRYDGRVRNPFNEYECGHWYARAMASYALIYGLTGVRYDRVSKTLYVEPSIKGDFKSFLATETGFGVVEVKGGTVRWNMSHGTLEVDKVVYQPQK